jgi:hypothetical protein
LKQLLKSNLTANGKLLRGNSAPRIDNARHFDIDEIAGRKMAFGLPLSAAYRGSSWWWLRTTSISEEKFLDNDWGEGRIVKRGEIRSSLPFLTLLAG